MTIYYLQSEPGLTAGGLTQIYRHVNILYEGGYDARILFLYPEDEPPQEVHTVPYAHLSGHDLARRLGKVPLLGERIYNRWLAARPLIQNPQVGLEIAEIRPDGSSRTRQLTRQDILVLPEFYGVLLRTTHDSVPVVVFNQGPHLSFEGGPPSGTIHTIYTDPILAVITVSEHGQRFLKTGYPNLNIFLTPNSVNTSLFTYSKEKKKQIAFMPRKLSGDLNQIFTLLDARGSLYGWEKCKIENMSRQEVARALKESAIFISTLSQEGFGLPPLEAALCGCVVVGYTGFAANEFMDPRFCFPVPERDVLAFVTTIENVVNKLNSNQLAFRDSTQLFAETLQDRYSEAHQKSAVLATWKNILEQHQAHL